MYQMKWHQQWNYATVQIKQLDIQEDTLFFSRHVEKSLEMRRSEVVLLCCSRKTKRQVRPGSVVKKKTQESIWKLYSIIGHRLRWESTPLVHVVLFALNKRLFCWQICNKEPTSADIRPCQELVSAIGVSVQINLHEGFTGTKTFDLNESLLLRHRHRQDFPLTRDSEAIYSTKALWRSMLAVIIQLIGYEESSNAIAALLTPWTLLKTGGVFSHSDNKRSSE